MAEKIKATGSDELSKSIDRPEADNNPKVEDQARAVCSGPLGGEGGGSQAGGGKQPKHWLDYVSLVVSTAVLLVAVLGFFLTWSQIRNATAQIEGSTLYQVARDGRDLMREQREGKAQPADILSYFHAAYLLHKREVIDEEGWAPIRRAYCNYLRNAKSAKQYLESYRNYYDERFNEFSKPYEEGAECE